MDEKGGQIADENQAPPKESGLKTISIEDFEAEALAEISARVQARKVPRPNTPRTHLAQSGPIPLSSPKKPSQFVPAFTFLCQAKGITPIFDYYTPSGLLQVPKGSPDGSPGFGAKVTFAGKEVKDDGPWQNKKAAKERVAEKAMPILKEMTVEQKTQQDEAPSENWIGLLNGESKVGAESKSGEAAKLFQSICKPLQNQWQISRCSTWAHSSPAKSR